MSSTIDIESIIADADGDLPALFQLMGGYFHQDWREEHPSVAAALSAFLAEAPPAAVRAAADELERVLALPLRDEELGELLRDGLHCAYLPERDGLSNRDWLRAVHDRLQPRSDVS